MKIKWIEIENFQSIKHLRTEDFEENAVIAFMGDNDAGKSTIGRALRILLFNDIGRGIAGFVRTGEDSFKITACTHNGFIISTTRGARNFYELTSPDGEYQKFTKLERSTPQVIAEIINAYIDPLSGNILNYRMVEDPLLLINNSGSEVYTIIQQSMNTLEIKDAIDRANAELNGCRDLVDKHEFKIEINKDKINKTVIVDEYEFLSAKATLVNLSEVIELTKNLEENLNAAERLVKLTAEIDEVNAEYAEIVGTNETIGIVDRLIGNKSELEKIPNSVRVAEEILGLGEAIADNRDVMLICNRIVKNEEERKNTAEKLTKIKEILTADIEGQNNLRNLLEGLLAKVEDNKQTKKKMTEIDNSLVGLRNKEVQILNSLGVCPTCKQNTSNIRM